MDELRLRRQTLEWRDAMREWDRKLRQVITLLQVVNEDILEQEFDEYAVIQRQAISMLDHIKYQCDTMQAASNVGAACTHTEGSAPPHPGDSGWCAVCCTPRSWHTGRARAHSSLQKTDETAAQCRVTPDAPAAEESLDPEAPAAGAADVTTSARTPDKTWWGVCTETGDIHSAFRDKQHAVTWSRSFNIFVPDPVVPVKVRFGSAAPAQEGGAA